MSWAKTTPSALVPEYSRPIGAGAKPLRKIKDAQIVSMRALAQGHPVFEIVFKGPTENLVIKNEMGQAANYTQVAAVFNAATKNAVSQVLDAEEIEELRNIKCPKPQPFAQHWALMFAPPNFWVKMPMVAGLKSTDGFNPVELVALVTATKGQMKVWTSLGKILAADLLTGNGDRFRIKKRSVAIGSWGNIFFYFDENQAMKKALAIDNFDPNAQKYGLGADSANWIKDFGIYFDRVNGAMSRHQLAQNIVAAINQHVRTQAAPAALGAILPQLPSMLEADFLRQGLENGIRKIAMRTQARVGFLPSVVLKQRLACIVGW